MPKVDFDDILDATLDFLADRYNKENPNRPVGKTFYNGWTQHTSSLEQVAIGFKTFALKMDHEHAAEHENRLRRTYYSHEGNYTS